MLDFIKHLHYDFEVRAMVTAVFAIWILEYYQAVRFDPSRHCIFAERLCLVQRELAMIVHHDIKGAARRLTQAVCIEPFGLSYAHSSSERCMDAGVRVLRSVFFLLICHHRDLANAQPCK